MGFIDKFHTGAFWQELFEPIHDPEYSEWQLIKDSVKLSRLLALAELESDGSLTPSQPIGYPSTPSFGIDFTTLTTRIGQMLNSGMFPILDLWIGNFETFSEAGLRIFLRNLSSHLGANQVVFNPCCEFNLEEANQWGERGVPTKTWRVIDTDYERQMKLIRRVLDEEGITNVLLGAHPEAHPDLTWAQCVNRGVFSDAYLEGMRQADVVGVSSYWDSVGDVYSKANSVYRAIGTEKPFIFFELGCCCFPSICPEFTLMNSAWINEMYSKLPANRFVKGFIIHFDSHYVGSPEHPAAGPVSSEVFNTIKVNADKYEGVTPTPPILATLSLAGIGTVIGYALKPKAPIVPMIVGAVAGGTVGFIIDHTLRS